MRGVEEAKQRIKTILPYLRKAVVQGRIAMGDDKDNPTCKAEFAVIVSKGEDGKVCLQLDFDEIMKDLELISGV